MSKFSQGYDHNPVQVLLLKIYFVLKRMSFVPILEWVVE
jgi:hypothetical protein